MIDTEKDNKKLVERAFVIGVQDKDTNSYDATEHLNELKELVKGIDIPIIDEEMVKLKKTYSKYLIGSGKAEEINEKLKLIEGDCLVFDCELSPSQQRNWEALTKVCVVDRQEIILDIFANRASTRESVLQVELARMNYTLPRLTRAWTHLSRQRGGAKGTRGEGEQQIEVDRRLVQAKIKQLRKELLEIKNQRNTQRKQRIKSPLPHVAIVGYTNAGKSSLLNYFSDAGVLAEDKLFATLDPTTRKVKLSNNQQLLITDTVGFVRKLPHHLVDAFKSTLEEAVLADFLLIIMDVSNPYVEDHWETTLEVLDDLGAKDKKKIIAFNKIDLQDNIFTIESLKNKFPNSLFISTVTGEGIDELEELLINEINDDKETINLKIPPNRYDIVALGHKLGCVLSSSNDDYGNYDIKLIINKLFLDKFEDYIF